MSSISLNSLSASHSFTAIFFPFLSVPSHQPSRITATWHVLYTYIIVLLVATHPLFFPLPPAPVGLFLLPLLASYASLPHYFLPNLLRISLLFNGVFSFESPRPHKAGWRGLTSSSSTCMWKARAVTACARKARERRCTHPTAQHGLLHR